MYIQLLNLAQSELHEEISHLYTVEQHSYHYCLYRIVHHWFQHSSPLVWDDLLEFQFQTLPHNLVVNSTVVALQKQTILYKSLYVSFYEAANSRMKTNLSTCGHTIIIRNVVKALVFTSKCKKSRSSSLTNSVYSGEIIFVPI